MESHDMDDGTARIASIKLREESTKINDSLASLVVQPSRILALKRIQPAPPGNEEVLSFRDRGSALRRSTVLQKSPRLTWLLVLCFFSITILSLSAQINPPNLLCVKSDTLIWDLPINTCGTFNSYNIYQSALPQGPYVLLAAITDPNQLSYFHDNASDMTWYYYMETDADCPGEPVVYSDTLNNDPPDVSPIIYTDILSGKVFLEWTASASPEVIGYIIYRTTELGTLPIDTVMTTTYYDLGSDPNVQAENYYVIALDACGNTSLLVTPHRTVFVTGEVVECEQRIYLDWDLYKGWLGIERQEIWSSINGSPPVLEQTLGDTATRSSVPILTNAATYCFFIKSYDVTTGSASTSNEVCLTGNVIIPVREFALKNISVNTNNEVKLSWQWNTDADLSDFSILSSNNNENFTLVETLPSPSPFELNNIYTDLTTDPSIAPIYYQMTSRDLCDSTARSNYGASIHLSGESNDNLENILNWTPFIIENATVNSYEIFRLTNNGPLVVGQLSADEFVFTDEVDPGEALEANVCYYIVAESVVSLIGGQEEIVRSHSNTVCVQQPTGIIAPNAFAPHGINSEFRPLLRFGDSADYQMTIFDRWGQKIFESNDLQIGWTGRKGYREYPMGAYTYLIKVTQVDGRRVEERGVVNLIR